jgi:ketosteroid isomerase-like protein
MTRARHFLIVLAVAAAGCGGSSDRTPAQVVRAWSAALNRGDEEAASALFGPNAVFVAGDYQTVLRTHADVLAFHQEMVWCGPIVRLAAHGDEVEAQFSLATRPNRHCERGGRERGSVYFRIRDGKIVFFDQIGE